MAFLSLKAKQRKQRALEQSASQGPTLPRADRARRPPEYYSDIEYDRAGRPKAPAPPTPEPNMEVAGESESEAGWVTEEGEEEDEMDLSVSLRESTEKQKNADSEGFDKRTGIQERMKSRSCQYIGHLLSNNIEYINNLERSDLQNGVRISGVQ